MPAVTLPIDEVMPGILAPLAAGRDVVLQAAPGAGKTTRVPLALLDQGWTAGRRILVLEPRRLAARAAARHMAALLGEQIGETVGYRVRMDSKVGPRTRIELVTDGLFLRRLQQDPELDGVAAVLFDEVHERGLDNDLALTLCLEAKAALRDDLRLVAMSATLEAERFVRLLGGAELVISAGRAFPVETRHLERSARGRLEDDVAAAVRKALAEEAGDILVFLPGTAEIRRTAERLGGIPGGVQVHPLYGDLTREAQDEAIAPSAPGRRKVVLATAIAETSLTIEGVRVVIDAGLARLPRFDPASGMSRLITTRVSQASAEQRRGRAGRVAAGVCYRLWGEAEDRALPLRPEPEILTADLAPLALELAAWGVRDAAALTWADPPPAAALAQARGLLRDLGALDAADAITPHGRRMAGIGTHPRLAHMILGAAGQGHGRLACLIAALLEERDIVRTGRDIDLRGRIDLVRRGRGPADQMRRAAQRWIAMLPRDAVADEPDPEAAGAVLALAYPDRIAQLRPGSRGRFLMANGRGAVVDETDALAASPWLAIADLDGDAREARVFRAAPLAQADVEALFGQLIVTETVVAWDDREGAVAARRRRRLGAIPLKDDRWSDPPAEAVVAATLDGIRRLGLAVLPWTRSLEQLRARVALVAKAMGGDWPDFSDAGLLAQLDDWLGPFVSGITRRSQFDRIDLDAALSARLSWDQRQRLDQLAPTHFDLPSGNRAAIDYRADGDPFLSVKLQEMLGQIETPTVAGGRVPLTIELLSPPGRPLQVTRDLTSFWRNGYVQVRAEMRGRYPKHDWPEDPFTAIPHRGTKRALQAALKKG